MDRHHSVARLLLADAYRDRLILTPGSSSFTNTSPASSKTFRMAGDYDHLLKVSMETVDVSFCSNEGARERVECHAGEVAVASWDARLMSSFTADSQTPPELLSEVACGAGCSPL